MSSTNNFESALALSSLIIANLIDDNVAKAAKIAQLEANANATKIAEIRDARSARIARILRELKITNDAISAKIAKMEADNATKDAEITQLKADNATKDAEIAQLKASMWTTLKTCLEYRDVLDKQYEFNNKKRKL